MSLNLYSVRAVAPWSDFSAFEQEILSLGLSPHLLCVARITPLPYNPQPLPPDIIITSYNTVGALRAQNISLNPKRLWCVGHRLAAEFPDSDTQSFASAESLLNALSQKQAGHALYLRGRLISRDIATPLQATGWTVHQQYLYETHKTDIDLSPFLMQDTAGFLLWSPQTAKAFFDSLGKRPLDKPLLCLSEQIATQVPVNLHPWIRVSKEKDAKAMIALIKQELGK